MFEVSDNSIIKKYAYCQFAEMAVCLAFASVFYLFEIYGFIYVSILLAFMSFSKAICYLIYIGWKKRRESRNKESNEFTFFKVLTSSLFLITVITYGVIRFFVEPPNDYYVILLPTTGFLLMSLLTLIGLFIEQQIEKRKLKNSH